jgi:hypothetical protein
MKWMSLGAATIALMLTAMACEGGEETPTDSASPDAITPGPPTTARVTPTRTARPIQPRTPTRTPIFQSPTLDCDPSYPDVCIPSPPPDLDCPQVRFRRFSVIPPDPHGFDGDFDGIGCESG